MGDRPSKLLETSRKLVGCTADHERPVVRGTGRRRLAASSPRRALGERSWGRHVPGRLLATGPKLYCSIWQLFG